MPIVTSTGITPGTLQDLTKRFIKTLGVSPGEVKPIVENRLVQAEAGGLGRLSAYVSNPRHHAPQLDIFFQSLPNSDQGAELFSCPDGPDPVIFRYIDKTKIFDADDGTHVPLRLGYTMSSDKELPTEDELRKTLYLASNIKVDEEPHLIGERFSAAYYYREMLRYIHTLQSEISLQEPVIS